MMQKEPAEGEQIVDIIILTHVAKERSVDTAIQLIEGMPTISGSITKLRLENLDK
jgi:homoserine dehydrogenase